MENTLRFEVVSASISVCDKRMLSVLDSLDVLSRVPEIMKILSSLDVEKLLAKKVMLMSS